MPGTDVPTGRSAAPSVPAPSREVEGRDTQPTDKAPDMKDSNEDTDTGRESRTRRL